MFRPAAGRTYNSSTSFSHLKDTLFGKESWVSLPVLPPVRKGDWVSTGACLVMLQISQRTTASQANTALSAQGLLHDPSSAVKIVVHSGLMLTGCL
jgi:hypothetical protein